MLTYPYLQKLATLSEQDLTYLKHKNRDKEQNSSSPGVHVKIKKGIMNIILSNSLLSFAKIFSPTCPTEMLACSDEIII